MATRPRPTPLPTSPARSLSLVRSEPAKSAGRSAARLTIKLLDAMRPGDVIRDASCRGMYAECGRRGNVSLKVAVDIARGKTVRRVIGHFPGLDLTEARAIASRLKADVTSGKVDPRPRAAAPAVAVGPAVLTVGAAIEAYLRGMQRRERDPATIKATEACLRNHLGAWFARDITTIGNTDCQHAHDRITDTVGKGAANATLRKFRAVRRHAIRKADRELSRMFDPHCPVASVDLHEETPRNDLCIELADLPEWWRRTGEISNPARVVLLRFGLLSGLRPHNVAGCRREWIDLDAPGGAVIRFPARAMKTRQPHTLPLSAPMVQLVRRALELGELVAPEGGGWLFPAVARGGSGASGGVVGTRNWHQPGFSAAETGHGLRRTYRMLAAGAGVAASDAETLLGHSLPKVQRAYFNAAHDAVQAHLRACQEQISAYVLRACGADPGAAVVPAPPGG
jgi:integrase